MVNNFKYRILNRLNLLSNKYYIKKVQLHEKVWKIPLVDGIGYSFTFSNNTEEWIYRFLKYIIPHISVDLFLDVGVNIGQTLLKVKSINPSIKYLGIEPSIDCAFYVNQFIKLNRLDYTDIICAAAGQTDTKILPLISNSSSDTRATTSKNDNTPCDMEKNTLVTVVSIDSIFDYCKMNFKNLVIKIDVEGSELDVLRGARMVLLKYNPIVIFEVLPHQDSKDVKNNQIEIYKFFTDLDYKISNLSQSGEITEILSFNNRDNFNLTDYLAIPSSVKKLALKV